MPSSSPSIYTPTLLDLMQKAGIGSFKALSLLAGVSKGQVQKLRQGNVLQIRAASLLKLSVALRVSLPQLLTLFSPSDVPLPMAESESIQLQRSLTAIQHEYQQLQSQHAQQLQLLQQQFQLEALRIIESWLLYWPTAAKAAQENSQMAAVQLLHLTQPLETLLEQWHVRAIAPVGAELRYDPHQHQLIEGQAQPGDRVRVRHMGYYHGDKLLFRAKVSSM
jgi:transcriptional regulator with XRE-family HTH domain